MLKPKKRYEEEYREAEEERIAGYRIDPRVLKAYRDADQLSEYWLKASEENEKNFWLQQEASKKPVTRTITKLVRLQNAFKEYFFYHEEVESESKLGAPIHYYHTVGKVEIPQFVPDFNPGTGQKMGASINKVQTVYDLEWPKDLTPELEKLVSDDVDMIVISKDKHYGGFTFADFKERSFEELVTLGKFGTLSPAMVKEVKTIQEKRRLEKLSKQVLK